MGLFMAKGHTHYRHGSFYGKGLHPLKAWVFLWQRATPIKGTGLFMAKGHTHYCGMVHGPHVEKVTIFIVHTQFTNVAAGRITHPGGLHVVNT
jgi:hypothetical protein